MREVMYCDREHAIQRLAVMVLAIVLGSRGAIAGIPRYKVFETTIVNSNAYANKFTDVELEAEFTSPSGDTMSWRGFYDGDGRGGGDCQTGSVWRLRFMPDEVGTWSYVYTWTDGTSGGSGSFNCVADGAGKGVIRAYRDNPRWFAYNGTTPVFLKSYHLYYEGLLHHDIDWTVKHVYQKLIDAGYNHLQIYLLPVSWYEPKTWTFADAPATVSRDHLFDGTHPSRTMDLCVCHNLDKHMTWLNDHDVGLLGHQGFDGKEKGARFHDLSSTEQDFYVKYMCARLAPYANICGWNYTWETRGDGPELIWADLIMKYDLWSHLRSYHDRWPDSGPEGDAGHHFADSQYSLANIENHIQDYNHPGSHDPSTHHRVTLSAYAEKPVFMSEGNGLWRWFWGANEDEIHRNAWAVTTAGGSFCWTDHTEGGSSATIFSWADVKNRIDYLTHIMTEDLRFYRMAPHDELLSDVTSGATCYCLAEVGRQYLVYKEEGGAFDLCLAKGEYTAIWIDTRTNERQSVGDVAGTGGDVHFNTPGNNTEWLLLLANSSPTAGDVQAAIHEPIRLHPDNPHYLEFRGEPTVLVGSTEMYGAVYNRDFDYTTYLDVLQADGLNVTRLFTGTWIATEQEEYPDVTLAPPPGEYIGPWARSDVPGYVKGGNKFDLTQWDEAYFTRLKDYITQAGMRGIVVEVSLFCVTYGEKFWNILPTNPSNNVNSIPVKEDDLFSLKNTEILAVHEAFVRKIVSELRDSDNIYYEICNEPYFGVSEEWQRHIADVIIAEERSYARQHLIAQNIANRYQTIVDPHPGVSIFNFHYTKPEAVSDNYGLGKVIADDETGFAGPGPRPYRQEAWKVILSGAAIYDNLDGSFQRSIPQGTGVGFQSCGGGPELRRQLGVLKKFMEGFDFVRMAPAGDVYVRGPGEGYVLAEPGRQYAMWMTGAGGEQGDEFTFNLPEGNYRFAWVDTKNGGITTDSFEHSGGPISLSSPTYVEDIALRIIAISSAQNALSGGS